MLALWAPLYVPLVAAGGSLLRLRFFVDHAQVRQTCLRLIAAHEGRERVVLRGEQVPPELRTLGDRVVVTVHAERVRVDVSNAWIEHRGFTVFQVPSPQHPDPTGPELLPGLYGYRIG